MARLQKNATRSLLDQGCALPGFVWTAMSTSCYQQFRWVRALTCNQAHNSGAQSQVSHHKGQCCQGEGGHCLQGQLLGRDQVPGRVTRQQGRQGKVRVRKVSTTLPEQHQGI
jgi:hypothetical protein